MTDFWGRMIQRAGDLAPRSKATRELLVFYEKLLESQKQVYEYLRGCREWLPSGSLICDLPILKDALPALLWTVESYGPAPLAQGAKNLLKTKDNIIDEVLLTYWHSPSDDQFFAKAILQPYTRWLAESGGRPIDRTFNSQENRCPFCGGMPQVSFLQIRETSAESGNRDLVCATCLTNWPFRRVVCAYCGEERPFKLGYFQTKEYAHVRVEACDTCKHYIKGIDLTLFGLAIPLVDEVAAAALDVWAQEHGYTKIEMNMVGL
jgi:FdhE protein